MPSSTTKQAKVMSALSHGWRPSQGDVAKIPLKVARDFHAADAGHKYGKGHDKKKKADGGAAMRIAYAIRRAEGGQVFHGPIVSAVPGRTDQHDMDVASGSYVLPSETISHLGENNTLAGLEKIKQLGPHGLRHLVRSCGGATEIIAKHKRRASGGGVQDQAVGRPIPVVTAGGEHVLAPQEVGVIGDGDMTLGHRLLDNFVMKSRKKHIATLQKLKPPAQD